MLLEVGSVLEGKVTGITNFGAFVDLPEGKTGMVHISEVAPTYVNQIRDHLSEGQMVKVKILSIGEDGKISLSIKKAMANQETPNEKGGRSGNYRGEQRNERGSRPFNKRPDRPRPAPVTSPGNYEWQSGKRNNDSSSFEDMMSRFKQTSDEKISDLKRGSESFNRRPRKNVK